MDGNDERGRQGSSWCQDEDRRVYDAFVTGCDITELARVHGRTEGAIKKRLQRLGLVDFDARPVGPPWPAFEPVSKTRSHDGQSQALPYQPDPTRFVDPFDIKNHCVSIDLEVNPERAKLKSFAAVKSGQNDKLVFESGDLKRALRELESFVETAPYIIGHNIIHFDDNILDSLGISAAFLRKPRIDTLWLNPLAFPSNPYHHLVKHYQDGRIEGGHINDPELDARLVFDVLDDQIIAFSELQQKNPALLLAFHGLTAERYQDRGFEALFSAIRGAPKPRRIDLLEAVVSFLEEKACQQQIEPVLDDPERLAWPLAYALSWISVAGGNSVMPPWVTHRFPEASQLVRQLRDTPCSNPWCSWCRFNNDPKEQLRHWFGFDDFRPEPKGADGRPLQEAIVACAMEGDSVLGILPTGTGKSVCYQLPALARFAKTGALTIVISPLVALMADQVEGLIRQQINSCVTINSLLSLPARQKALDQIRLGDASILLISPEQLRNRSIQSILKQREIGYWVLDEAHCLSKWGHDFRPDYRYVARFIKESAGDEPPPPIVCLTATAKPDVINDITDYFRRELGVALSLIDGGAKRRNLDFQVVSTNGFQKDGDIVTVLQNGLPREGRSGAIVYCATRKATERVSEYLKNQGFAADHFHAGLKPDAKQDVQRRFREGELRVIAATNAFGMGIDKPDIRLVVHGDIPGSLENYLQEAGRAGRDQEPARCVLLFGADDIERQFSLNARSRLTKREISSVLKALWRLERQAKANRRVVATSGEIVKEELDQAFVRDSATDDTRVKTAIAWLENAQLLRREENRIQIYPSSLKIRTMTEAEAILRSAKIRDDYRTNLRNLVQCLMTAKPAESLSTDDLCGASGFKSSELRKAFHDLERYGIASNDTKVTIYLNIGIEDSSSKRLQRATGLEHELIRTLRELAPDLSPGETSELSLRHASQALRDKQQDGVRPDIVERLIRSISLDGREEDGGEGSFVIQKRNREHLSIRLIRAWHIVDDLAARRRKAAQVLLCFLEDKVRADGDKSRGKDIEVETTLGDLIAAITGDLELARESPNPQKLMDRALLWMHEQSVVSLGNGLTIFRPAMTVDLNADNKQFTKADYTHLEEHYREQTLQVHIMDAYGRRGLESVEDALRLSNDYFEKDRDSFLATWLKTRSGELQRQTTPASWEKIVSSLNNQQQARIVSDDREQTNVLVIAGPGSGKTRVLVHRIAYLIRVKRENPRGILALVYNRHAATEIQKRLFDLIGDDARGVVVSTCHGLAMRLVGSSFAARSLEDDPERFNKVLKEATELLQPKDLSGDEAEAQREMLIQGYRWILVDEYQDIGEREYDLISAVAGRSLEDDDSRLSLFAVGDDDQNIYAFNGTSVEFIRKFEADYKAKPVHLIENYRSTANIIHAANCIIAPAAERMKVGHDIQINKARQRDPGGGGLMELDPVGAGRVQVLDAGSNDFTQAILAVEELRRLSRLVPDWDWSKAAIVARTWKQLDPVRSYCEAEAIPVQLANEKMPGFWRLREVQQMIAWLHARAEPLITTDDLSRWLDEQESGPWWSLLGDALGDFASEFGDHPVPIGQFREWLAEWGFAVRKKQTGLLLVTVHGAKGAEFDDAVVLDGGWWPSGEEELDDVRRLYYVAMTRARRSLTLMKRPGKRHTLLDGISDSVFLFRRQTTDDLDVSGCQRIYRYLTKGDVYLSYAGNLPDNDPSLKAIKDLSAGDEILLDLAPDARTITNKAGVTVSKLAKNYKPPKNATFLKGFVSAIQIRNKDESDPKYISALKRDNWEYILPELIFERL